MNRGLFANPGAMFLPPNAIPILFSVNGNIAVVTGPHQFTAMMPHRVLGTTARLGTAPASQAAIFDTQRNGVSVFQVPERPTIAASGNYSGNSGYVWSGLSIASLNPILNPGDYINHAVLQVGSGTTGADLVLTTWVVPLLG